MRGVEDKSANPRGEGDSFLSSMLLVRMAFSAGAQGVPPRLSFVLPQLHCAAVMRLVRVQKGPHLVHVSVRYVKALLSLTAKNALGLLKPQRDKKAQR